jgi:hypothetical protein
MKRYSFVIGFAALAGCNQPTMDKVDLFGVGGDGGMQDLVANNNKDLVMKLPTGAPCMSKTECGGTSPTCEMKLQSGEAFPGGYCSSTCSTSMNDPNNDGLNPKCPGGTGTCVGGKCYTKCTGSSNMTNTMPCERMGYACFNIGMPVCLPASHSQCDPNVRDSCPQDGGLVTDTDAGTLSGQVCAPVGEDPVGQCVAACDVFVQNCPDLQNGNKQGCYAEYKFGLGLCFGVVGGGMDGAACQYLNGCDPGFACTANKCRAYCGGPNNVMCTNGKMCAQLSMMSPPTTVVGVCGG